MCLLILLMLRHLSALICASKKINFRFHRYVYFRGLQPLRDLSNLGSVSRYNAAVDGIFLSPVVPTDAFEILKQLLAGTADGTVWGREKFADSRLFGRFGLFLHRFFLVKDSDNPFEDGELPLLKPVISCVFHSFSPCSI